MKRWAKGTLLGVAGLVGLIAVVTVIGVFLPERHQAARTLMIAEPANALWVVITDHAREPSWRHDLDRVERLPDRAGHAVWREVYRSGNTLTLETTAAEAPHRLVRRIADMGGAFSGEWEIRITETGAGASLVRITERSAVHNPFFRFVSKYVIGHTRYMERYLRALAAKFGEEPVIS